MSKEKMMKKLLILMLVLGLTSMASAVPYFAVDPVKDSYEPSDWITIEVRDDDPLAVDGFMIDCITDNTGGTVIGIAAEPQYFDPSIPVTFQYPGLLNVDNQLVEYASGAAGSGVPTDAVIYSFEYHVPDVPASTWIEIQTDWDDDWWFAPKFDYHDGSSYIGAVTPVLIHVVPEPATLALLGLGGLLLRRRK